MQQTFDLKISTYSVSSVISVYFYHWISCHFITVDISSFSDIWWCRYWTFMTSVFILSAHTFQHSWHILRRFKIFRILIRLENTDQFIYSSCVFYCNHDNHMCALHTECRIFRIFHQSVYFNVIIRKHFHCLESPIKFLTYYGWPQ